MPQIREQIAMVHLPPSKTLKYLFHVRKTKISKHQTMLADFYFFALSFSIVSFFGYSIFILPSHIVFR